MTEIPGNSPASAPDYDQLVTGQSKPLYDLLTCPKDLVFFDWLDDVM
ncbi:hypothetical protein [Streptomyces hokutonensis]